MSNLNSSQQPNVNQQAEAALTSRSPRGIARSRWAFWIPLLFQSVLILWVPVQATHTLTTGQTVTLQTAPVDPYDLFRGYYVTLSYEISEPSRLSKLPGWNEAIPAQDREWRNGSTFLKGADFYLVLEAPKDTTTTPPQPWQPVAVHRDRPTHLPNNQVALHGQYQMGQVLYDLERYYIPEEQRNEINQYISEAQQQPLTAPPGAGAIAAAPFVVDIKVGNQGQAVPLRFWLKDRSFQF
ncbi:MULTISPECIES: GDYXXLXY domain-containing protein [unclassified Leptolyngbya]|uniref:GDYXXLXY domain-containing protein n=1 Tax=unclassified Leptolyngbya TaxID=2650499 RepID=UPI0016845EF2|nr:MULTISPECIES: GDYXXLXY domain-containing protein [unclassified Leptolyngbya]MBD1910416.1 GDYXXLXY domain-containing protein [Leptolyngbya sp. FACHB-8]MBD2154184.1 GDYXXLXY domain-containing protein [Leptolyngbya sp. FACHB-16]